MLFYVNYKIKWTELKVSSCSTSRCASVRKFIRRWSNNGKNINSKNFNWVPATKVSHCTKLKHKEINSNQVTPELIEATNNYTSKLPRRPIREQVFFQASIIKNQGYKTAERRSKRKIIVKNAWSIKKEESRPKKDKKKPKNISIFSSKRAKQAKT